MNKYVDMHCHILPEIDDGAKNERESIKNKDKEPYQEEIGNKRY